jgi:hypothetical protein
MHRPSRELMLCYNGNSHALRPYKPTAFKTCTPLTITSLPWKLSLTAIYASMAKSPILLSPTWPSSHHALATPLQNENAKREYLQDSRFHLPMLPWFDFTAWLAAAASEKKRKEKRSHDESLHCAYLHAWYLKNASACEEKIPPRSLGLRCIDSGMPRCLEMLPRSKILCCLMYILLQRLPCESKTPRLLTRPTSAALFFHDRKNFRAQPHDQFIV